jgi:hypothetical protein
MESIVGWFLREGGNPKKSGPQPTEKKARLSVTYEFSRHCLGVLRLLRLVFFENLSDN